MNTHFKGIDYVKALVPVLILSVLTACGEVTGQEFTTADEPPVEEIVFAAPAVAQPVQSAPAQPEDPVLPYLMPGEPPEPETTLVDIDSSLRAHEKRALSGDKFLESLYERPFTAVEMEYLPDADIQAATIAADDDFYYFGIQLKAPDPAENSLTASYGIEFDRGKRGRGDLLVWAGGFTPQWSLDGLTVYEDANQDVGGLNPLIANQGHEGDGYETALEFTDEKVAFARLSPDDPATVQFAVSRALLDGAEEFLWGAWADRSWQDPGRFDYNDFIGPGAAGSPIINSGYYPVKDLPGLDNTCRRAYGFAPTYDIRGMCTSKPVPEASTSSGGDCQTVCYNFGNQQVCTTVCN